MASSEITETSDQQTLKMLRLVTNNLPIRVSYVNQEFRYLYVNDAYERELGMTAKSLIGRSVADVMGERVFAIARPLIARGLAGETYTQDFEVPYSAGARWIRTTFIPDFAQDGNVLGGLWQVIDVSAERAAQSAAEKERLIREQTLETARVATFDWDAINDQVFGNELLNKFYGRAPGDQGLPLEKYLAAIDPADLSETVRKINQAITDDVPYETEYRLSEGDEKQRWVLARGATRRDPAGNILRLRGVVVDITAQKQAEAEARVNAERFRQLVELSPSTVWVAGLDGGLTYISHDFYESTGMTEEESLPDGWTLTVHPDDIAGVAEKWEAARRDETRYDTEFRIRLGGGEYRWISARALPIRDEAGQVTSWLGNNSDIHLRKTEEGRLLAAVEKQTRELREAVNEAESFNYSISHDLRGPLRAIVATANILLEDIGSDLSPENRALLVRQTVNANRLALLIDELLKMSRLARVDVKRVGLDISAIARSAAEQIEPPCQVDIEDGLIAEGDLSLIHTVFENLLGNACKFSPDRGAIEVGRAEEAFFVKDHGIGFDTAYASRIFLPFERLVLDTEFEGTGIGLANVRRIVERHGGKVWAESEPGVGSTFYFTLPGG
ncbi:hypothetical protein BH11ARM1_BH11ARM1_12620 [soil metagenome]